MKRLIAIKKGWGHIKLIDRYLIIIMIILIVYSVATIFFGNAITESNSNIDVVVRTTIASIFGYFISSNFIKNEMGYHVHDLDIKTEIHKNTQDIEESNKTTMHQNKIGFTPESPGTMSSETEIQNVGYSKEPVDIVDPATCNLQVYIIGTLCVSSILVLLVVRFFTCIETNDSATLSQFRDIICGCVGYLIGMPADSTK